MRTGEVQLGEVEPPRTPHLLFVCTCPLIHLGQLLYCFDCLVFSRPVLAYFSLNAQTRPVPWLALPLLYLHDQPRSAARSPVPFPLGMPSYQPVLVRI